MEADVLVDQIGEGVFARLVLGHVFSLEDRAFLFSNPVLGVRQSPERLAKGFSVFTAHFSVECDRSIFFLIFANTSDIV